MTWSLQKNILPQIKYFIHRQGSTQKNQTKNVAERISNDLDIEKFPAWNTPTSRCKGEEGSVFLTSRAGRELHLHTEKPIKSSLDYNLDKNHWIE